MCLLVWYWHELSTEPHTLPQRCKLWCLTTDYGNLVLSCSRPSYLYPPISVLLYTVEIIYQCMFVSFKAHWQTMLFMLLGASCLTLEIKGFRCYEAKIEASKKASSHLELNPGHLWLKLPVLCHWAMTYSWTTTNPHKTMLEWSNDCSIHY